MIAQTLTMNPKFTQTDETVLRGPRRTDFDFSDFDHSEIPLEEEKWPVIIIGSSMVGMALGLLLGYWGYAFFFHGTVFFLLLSI